MSNFAIGSRITGSSTPTIPQRLRWLKHQLEDCRINGGWVTVINVEVPSASRFYAHVWFNKNGENTQTVVAGDLSCRKKQGGYWMSAECFAATGSMPPYLCAAPEVILNSLESVSMPAAVDADWLRVCKEAIADARHSAQKRKGNIFTATNGPVVTLGGRIATHAIVVDKKTVTFVCPTNGQTQNRPIADLGPNYALIEPERVKAYSDAGTYKEIAGILFEVKEGAATLKGKLAVGAKARMIQRIQREKAALIEQASDMYNAKSLFQTGGWFA